MAKHQAQPHEWEVVGDTLVTQTVPGEITDELWDEFLRELEAAPVRQIFSASMGSISLSSKQRKAAAEVMQRKAIRSIVLTDSRLTRGVLTAVSWLGANIKAFSWTDIEGAVQFSESPDEVKDRLRTIAVEFKRRESDR